MIASITLGDNEMEEKMTSTKWEVRARAQVTFDFEITAEDAETAEDIVKGYLDYVQGGKLDDQCISVQTEQGDKLTHCFIMDCECDDINELD